MHRVVLGPILLFPKKVDFLLENQIAPKSILNFDQEKSRNIVLYQIVQRNMEEKELKEVCVFLFIDVGKTHYK